MTTVNEVDPTLYGLYVAAWAFFAYGPQLVICMLFAWSACRRTRGDMLEWLTRGFLWSLLPFVGVAATWWLWRRASRDGAGPGAGVGSRTPEGNERRSGAATADGAEDGGAAAGGP